MRCITDGRLNWPSISSCDCKSASPLITRREAERAVVVIAAVGGD